MAFRQIYKCMIAIFLLHSCQSLSIFEAPEEDLLDFYNKYREVAGDERKHKSSRRFVINNVEYQMHVNRLRDVNGYKTHNLIIRTNNPQVNSTIYIDNPVESKLPQAYLSYDEFKEALSKRVEKEKEELRKSRLRAMISEKWSAKTKAPDPPVPTRTIYIDDVFKQSSGNESVKSQNPVTSSITTEKLTSKLKGTLTTKGVTQESVENKPKVVSAKEQNATIISSKADTTNTALSSTEKNFILRAIEDATINKINESVDNTTKEDNIVTESTVESSSLGELLDTTGSIANNVTETVTEAESSAESEEAEEETETDKPSTTTASTQGTYGRPYVFMNG